MKSKIIKVRYPNLGGKSIISAAKANEEKLIQTLDNLMIEEKNNVAVPKPKAVKIKHKPIEGGRTKNKKPKTFAL